MVSSMHKLTASMLSSALGTLSPTEAHAAKGYAVGVCQVQQRDLPENLYPITTASSYLYKYQRNNPAIKPVDLEAIKREAKASLMSRPKLGKIEVSTGRLGDDWDYLPTKFNKDVTYAGRDNFKVKVDYKGVSVFIHYYIEVIGNDPPTYIEGQERKGHFCNTESWKISNASDALVADESAQTSLVQLGSRSRDAASRSWYLDRPGELKFDARQVSSDAAMSDTTAWAYFAQAHRAVSGAPVRPNSSWVVPSDPQ